MKNLTPYIITGGHSGGLHSLRVAIQTGLWNAIQPCIVVSAVTACVLLVTRYV